MPAAALTALGPQQEAAAAPAVGADSASAQPYTAVTAATAAAGFAGSAGQPEAVSLEDRECRELSIGCM